MDEKYTADLTVRRAGFFASAASTLALAALTSTHAQNATPAAPQTTEAVVITGSRIARPDFVSSSPLVTSTAEDLRASGKINVETALQQMPQFAPAQDESSNAQAQGGGGRATVNLRALGESRTLVLLDGRRLVPSDGRMVVDLNSIALGIISDVEVITGGASAAYGSDAVAGVVNIKTKRHFDGVEVQGTQGAAVGGGAKRRDASITMGSEFANNRGEFLLSLNYSKRDALPASARSFFARGGPSGTTFFAGYTPSAGNLPTQAAVNAAFARYGSAPGAVGTSGTIFVNNDQTLYSNIVPLQTSGALVFRTATTRPPVR